MSILLVSPRRRTIYSTEGSSKIVAGKLANVEGTAIYLVYGRGDDKHLELVAAWTAEKHENHAEIASRFMMILSRMVAKYATQNSFDIDWISGQAENPDDYDGGNRNASAGNRSSSSNPRYGSGGARSQAAANTQEEDDFSDPFDS